MAEFIFSLVSEESRAPANPHPDARHFDLFSDSRVVVKPGERVEVGTGVIVKGVYGAAEIRFRPHPALSAKGVEAVPMGITSRYRGELRVHLVNRGSEQYIIFKGSRIAEMTFEDPRPTTMRYEEG